MNMLAPKSFLAAIGFLTRIPIGDVEISKRDQQYATIWFPAVGVLLGAVEASIAHGLGLVGFGNFAIAACVIAVSIVATGALHEDGLADTADAIGAYQGDRERFLAVLKDSRIGAFGATALCVSLLLRAALFTELGSRLSGALIIGETLSRAAPAWLLSVEPYVTPSNHRRSGELSNPPASCGPIAVTFAIGLSVIATISCAGIDGLQLATSLLFGGLAAVGLRAYFRSRVGGITGDLLGATQQVVLIVVLIALAASRSVIQ